jgi:putative transcriptional regulator
VGESDPAAEAAVSVPQRVDVQAIRKRLGLSQKEFAMRFGFTLGSVRNWEQGHRGPEGTARVLLTIVDYDPDTVERALRAVCQPKSGGECRVVRGVKSVQPMSSAAPAVWRGCQHTPKSWTPARRREIAKKAAARRGAG